MSTPAELATTTVAADGTYAVDFTIPAALATGAYTVQVQGNGQDGRLHALQVGIDVATLAATGAPLLPIGMAGVVLSLLGLIVLSTRRRSTTR
jgi:hypothetical protein